MFGLVALVQPEVDGAELLFRVFLNSQTRYTSESPDWEDCGLGKKPGLGLQLPDPYSSNNYD